MSVMQRISVSFSRYILQNKSLLYTAPGPPVYCNRITTVEITWDGHHHYKALAQPLMKIPLGQSEASSGYSALRGQAGSGQPRERIDR